MCGKKHSRASPEAGTENEPKRKVARYQSIAGLSTPVNPPNTAKPPSGPTPTMPTPPQQFRHVLPKPTPAFPYSSGSVPIDATLLSARVGNNQGPQAHQSPTDLLPTTMPSQGTLMQGSGITSHTLPAEVRGSINPQSNPNLAATTITPGIEFQHTMFAPISNAGTVMRNQGTALDLLGQISPHGPTPLGYCFSYDDLWRNHRESMMRLLRFPGVWTGDNELDSTPVTCNIFRTYFAIQDHVARYHGWNLGG